MPPKDTQVLSDLEFVIRAGKVATVAAAGASPDGLQTFLTCARGDSTDLWLRFGNRSTSANDAVGECARGGESDSRDVAAEGGEADFAAASAGREPGT